MLQYWLHIFPFLQVVVFLRNFVDHFTERDCFLLLYIAVITPKPSLNLLLWLTYIESRKLESIHQRFPSPFWTLQTFDFLNGSTDFLCDLWYFFCWKLPFWQMHIICKFFCRDVGLNKELLYLTKLILMVFVFADS